MYAIRKDGQGWHAVNGEEDVAADENFSATMPTTTPAMRVPKVVTMRQARLALYGAGKLAAVNTAVASMPGAAGDAARIEWEYSGEVQRDKALVQALAPVLGLNDAQLDALFVAAAAL